ncbi:MAG: hypothetical protein U5K75_07030, partial [Ahrensia sp.]|nr:hypothetical protein [Ahrensia sp.]
MNNYSISFDPFLPWPFVWAAVVAAICLAALILFVRLRGAPLRSVAFFALAAALANPVINQEDRASLPTTVAIVVDNSQSQRIDGRAQTTADTVATLQEKQYVTGTAKH